MKPYLIALCLLLVATASAQMSMEMKHPASPFSKDMDSSMAKMDKDMSGAPMSGNADHDFASMMIPHHQGAVDMAEAELKYGHDPEMRDLATKIIAAQKVEIKQMKTWLEKKGGDKGEMKGM